MKRPLKERFVEKFKESNGCWEWQAKISPYGYGQFAIAPGNVQQAHRFAYELFVGPIPKGLCVLHDCDNRKCVNPAHLWVGTQAQNIHDMMKKGRDKKATADKNGRAKIDWDTALKIRAMAGKYPQKEITLSVGISRWQIRRITKGISWKV